MNVPRKLAGTATMQAVSLPDPSLWMREFAAHFELSRRQRPSAFHKSDFPVTWGFHVLRFRLFLLFTQLAPGGTLLPLPAPLWSSFSTLSQVIEEKMVIIITSVTTSGAKFSSVAQPCPTLCDPMSCSTPGLPVRHPTPGVYPNPCPLSRRYRPTISSSVIPFSSCHQSFPASGSSQ